MKNNFFRGSYSKWNDTWSDEYFLYYNAFVFCLSSHLFSLAISQNYVGKSLFHIISFHTRFTLHLSAWFRTSRMVDLPIIKKKSEKRQKYYRRFSFLLKSSKMNWKWKKLRCCLFLVLFQFFRKRLKCTEILPVSCVFPHFYYYTFEIRLYRQNPFSFWISPSVYYKYERGSMLLELIFKLESSLYFIWLWMPFIDVRFAEKVFTLILFPLNWLLVALDLSSVTLITQYFITNIFVGDY